MIIQEISHAGCHASERCGHRLVPGVDSSVCFQRSDHPPHGTRGLFPKARLILLSRLCRVRSLSAAIPYPIAITYGKLS